MLRALSSVGLGLVRELVAEEVAAHAVTIVGDIPNVDIRTRAWNLCYRQARPRAELFELEGVRISTASIDDLIESERTGRLLDAADAEVLEAIRRLAPDA